MSQCSQNCFFNNFPTRNIAEIWGSTFCADPDFNTVKACPYFVLDFFIWTVTRTSSSATTTDVFSGSPGDTFHLESVNATHCANRFPTNPFAWGLFNQNGEEVDASHWYCTSEISKTGITIVADGGIFRF